MKKLFQNAIEWLRSRVTAIVKVKGDRLKRSEARTPKIERLHSNDDRLKVKGDGLKVKGDRFSVLCALRRAKLRLIQQSVISKG